MAQAKFIRIDGETTTERTFNNSSPYEALKPNDVIEVDCEDGQIRDYYIESMSWDFTHFGDTLTITIKPTRPAPRLQPIKGDDGQSIGFIKS